MTLFSIVYVSIASKKMSEDDLLSLLEKARKHNRLNAVTGLLLYRDGLFIQALEGWENIIDDLFERIKQDDRHYNVFQVYKRPIAQRRFAKWEMGFESPNLDALQETPGFSEFIQLRQHSTTPATEFDNEVDRLLDKFVTSHNV